MSIVQDFINKKDAKAKTNKKSKFDEVKDAGGPALFTELADVLLLAFAYGYRINELGDTSGGTAFVNASSVDDQTLEEYARLILYRHPEVKTANEIWQYVQAYADRGIDELHTMMVLQKKRLNLDIYLEE